MAAADASSKAIVFSQFTSMLDLCHFRLEQARVCMGGGERGWGCGGWGGGLGWGGVEGGWRGGCKYQPKMNRTKGGGCVGVIWWGSGCSTWLGFRDWAFGAGRWGR